MLKCQFKLYSLFENMKASVLLSVSKILQHLCLVVYHRDLLMCCKEEY